MPSSFLPFLSHRFSAYSFHFHTHAHIITESFSDTANSYQFQTYISDTAVASLAFSASSAAQRRRRSPTLDTPDYRLPPRPSGVFFPVVFPPLFGARRPGFSECRVGTPAARSIAGVS